MEGVMSEERERKGMPVWGWVLIVLGALVVLGGALCVGGGWFLRGLFSNWFSCLCFIKLI